MNDRGPDRVLIDALTPADWARIEEAVADRFQKVRSRGGFNQRGFKAHTETLEKVRQIVRGIS